MREDQRDQPDQLHALLDDDSVETVSLAGHDTVIITSADARVRVRGRGPSLAASDEQLIDLLRRTTGKGERDV